MTTSSLDRIAGPLRVQSDGATTVTYELEALSGGSRCKVLLFSIRVLASSSNCALGLRLAQGPDGASFGAAGSIIPLAACPAPGTTTQRASGTPDTNSDDVLNEWLRPELECGVTSGTADEWAVVEVYARRLGPRQRAGEGPRPMRARREARGVEAPGSIGGGSCGCGPAS